MVGKLFQNLRRGNFLQFLMIWCFVLIVKYQSLQGCNYDQVI